MLRGVTWMPPPPQRTTYLDYCTGLQNERNRKFKISNKNTVSKKKNNRFGIYGIVSILFIIFLLFFPIHTVLSLKYSKPESLLNYFEVLVICHIPQEYHGAVLEKKELPMKNMMDT